MYETSVTIVGNVVDNPNHRRFDSGASVTSFRLASTARRFDRTSNNWIDGDSLFVKVSCWRALADNVYRSVVKGDPVIITGSLSTKNYEVDGQQRTSYEVDAVAVGLNLAKGQGSFFARTKDNKAELPIHSDLSPNGTTAIEDRSLTDIVNSANDNRVEQPNKVRELVG